MENLRFAVIIPVFNKWELTRDCLKSLRRFTPGDEFEVIAVDNASSDATLVDLDPLGSALFGLRFKSIRNHTNRNFAAACNTGAKLAQAPFCFFLNNDTLLTENWAPPLEESLQNNPSLGAVGPLLLYADKTVQHLGVAFLTAGVAHLYRGFPLAHPLVSKTRCFQAITAAAFFVSRELFFAAGAFYEEYRNGFEDVELGLRICQLDKKLTCVPKSQVIHLESQSEGRNNDPSEFNEKLFQQRCAELFYPDYHLHGLSDGFRVVYDDSLNQSLLLPEKDDLALREQVTVSGSLNLSRLLQATQKNPYWFWGHEHMARELEKQKLFQEASAYYLQAFSIYCTLEGAKKLLKIAALTADTKLAKEADTYLAQIITLKNDQELCASILKRNIATAEKFNDKFLLRLSEQKLAELYK
ncbi:MAG: glycosyltransferase family 2 protein [Desulfovibrio sp.]|jgi:GT2 family glycosyltransferase|nr:glycosyltransferase family 2 protein [Desulfovibrio sp.]